LPGDKAPEAIEAQIWVPGTGQDPAKYLVNPGHWDDGSKSMTPGELAHARPWLDSGNRIFVWPTPTEGFRRTGTNMLGLHHYIGDLYVDAQLIHRDEARIEMSGVFAGLSAQDAMVDFQNTLNDDPPDAGMTLNVPGVFEQVKFVIPENWEFTHDADDQTHSISYTVTFVSIGEGRRLPDPAGAAPEPQGQAFPAAPVDLGPLDPWQIAIGIGLESQPGAPVYGGGGNPGGPPGGTGSAGTGIPGVDLVDFMYGNNIPGYTPEQLYAAAQAGNSGGTPAHVMKNGQLFNADGSPYSGTPPPYMSVKYIQPDGTNTILIPLPPPQAPSQNSTSSFRIPDSDDTSYTVLDGSRTLMQIAQDLYGIPDEWQTLYENNASYFDQFGVAPYQAGDLILPVGLKLYAT
jgi:hypothetical protein